MQTQYEDQSAIPEELKDSFVEFKDGDKTVFLHKDVAEAKREAFRFKGDLTQAQQKQQEALERLERLEKAEQARQAELEAKELEAKKQNGQHEEILEHFKAQAEKEKQELQQQLAELQNSVKAEKKAAIVSDLSSCGTPETKAVLSRLINLDLDFSESGEIVVLQDGKATSLSLDEYKAKLPELYPSLVGEVHGKGGVAKGGALGSGAAKKPEDYTEQERVELFKQDPQKFNQLFNLQ